MHNHASLHHVIHSMIYPETSAEPARQTNQTNEGILRDIDDQHHYTSRLTLWNDFNVCWLAVCQKQKDLTHELLQMGPFHRCTPTTLPLLAPDALEGLGSGLIQLCDKMEQHGLVDYQMGIWEEEILCSMFSLSGECVACGTTGG